MLSGELFDFGEGEHRLILPFDLVTSFLYRSVSSFSLDRIKRTDKIKTNVRSFSIQGLTCLKKTLSKKAKLLAWQLKKLHLNCSWNRGITPRRCVRLRTKPNLHSVVSTIIFPARKTYSRPFLWIGILISKSCRLCLLRKVTQLKNSFVMPRGH